MAGTTSQAEQTALTLEQYLQTPETMLRHEVLDGVIVMSPSPTFRHQVVLMKLSRAIGDHVDLHDLGTAVAAPADLLIHRIPKLTVRQPDLLFVARERMTCKELEKLQVLEIAPDLAVEIRSPSDSPARWSQKLEDYASIGVPEIWQVEPEAESIEVLALDGIRYVQAGLYVKDDRLDSKVLPGLALRVGSIFA